MPFTTLNLDLDGHVAVITLNRPDKRNAISSEMMDDLLGALFQAEASQQTRVVILTGAGKAFCAGMDLEHLKAAARNTPEEHLEDSRRMAHLFMRLYTFPKPLIAAVNGAAIAGGCGLATLSDFTLAVPEAKFGYSEVRIGFLPALVSVFLVRQIGEKHARELLLSGRLVAAKEAFRLGLVSEVVPAKKLMARARELAAELSAASPTSLARTKHLLRSLVEGQIERQISAAMAASAAIRSTADFREGMAAFLEKRPPKWGS